MERPVTGNQNSRTPEPMATFLPSRRIFLKTAGLMAAAAVLPARSGLAHLNYFIELEQAAFNVATFVGGSGPSPHKMLQGRLFSYGDALL